MVGTTISHYKILEKIGQGGMGTVYRAQDTTLDREVAIKVLPEQFTKDPQDWHDLSEKRNSWPHSTNLTSLPFTVSSTRMTFIFSCWNWSQATPCKSVLPKVQSL